MNEWLGKPVLPTRGRPLVFPGELVLQRTDFWCCKGKFRCCRREFKDVCTIFFFPVLCFDGDTDSFRFFFSFGEKEKDFGNCFHFPSLLFLSTNWKVLESPLYDILAVCVIILVFFSAFSIVVDAYSLVHLISSFP